MSALDRDDENTPLLATETKAVTPLPKLQLSLICFLRITEPIAFLVCFPFVNQMLLDVGAAKNPKDVGWPAAVVCPKLRLPFAKLRALCVAAHRPKKSHIDVTD